MDRRPPAADSLDEARILPHLRERARLERKQAETMRTEYARATAEGRDRTAPRRLTAVAQGEPGDLRGIPVVGARGVGGASPGTRPDSDSHLEHLDRNRAA